MSQEKEAWMQRTISTVLPGAGASASGSHTSTQSGHPRASLGLSGKESKQETSLRSLGPEDLLEKGVATHFGILAWEIQRTQEPGGLQSMGSQRTGHTERRSNNRAPSRQPWASAPWGGHRAGPGWHSGSSPATGGQGCSVLGLSPALALTGVGGLVRTLLLSLPWPSRGFPWGLCPLLPLQGP